SVYLRFQRVGDRGIVSDGPSQTSVESPQVLFLRTRVEAEHGARVHGSSEARHGRPADPLCRRIGYHQVWSLLFQLDELAHEGVIGLIGYLWLISYVIEMIVPPDGLSQFGKALGRVRSFAHGDHPKCWFRVCR